MAITQLNTADFDYAMMLNVINKSYKGKADITLSAFDTTAAPDVKVGSVFEDNGAIFIVDTADITPTGYAGITNSTTFYLYYDESASVFIYSNTAPTWSDVLQGWYNGNDRAFFSIFKDSGGTLYQSKSKLDGASRLLSRIIPIGDWDMDADTFVAVSLPSDIDWKSIRSISGVIRNDADTERSITGKIDNATNGTNDMAVSAIDDGRIVLIRVTGGDLDNTDYNSTSYNRGWLTLGYVT